jgi:hypothetical protein
MTEERKEQIVAGLKLLFFPITGFHFICKECKDLQPHDFMTEWFHYMLGVILWAGLMFGIGLVTWGLIFQFDKTIVPVSLIGGAIFFFLILPVIIHKIINRK